jgi:hypothetical protein
MWPSGKSHRQRRAEIREATAVLMTPGIETGAAETTTMGAVTMMMMGAVMIRAGAIVTMTGALMTGGKTGACAIATGS